jgi:hypothetical protein
MTDILLFLAENELWVYGLLAAAGLLYARRAVLRYLDVRRAIFGLERERALARMRRSLALLGLTIAAGVGTVIITSFIVPTLPAGLLGTPAPTISLLVTPGAEAPTLEPGYVSATALPEGPLDTSGCLNLEATILEPVAGASIGGMVEIRGTANITNFGFYKIEYRPSGGEAAWQPILAGDEPVIEGKLGEWDTQLVVGSGDYLLRLVVADTAGNAPWPCVVPVRITAGQ